MNTQSETFTPLVCSVIDHALLKAMPAIQPTIISVSSRYKFFWQRPMLINFYANFVVQRVQVWVMEPKIWWNKRGCLPLQKSEVGDTWHGGYAHSLSWHIVLLEDKKLTTDVAHDRQLLLSQKHVMVIRVDNVNYNKLIMNEFRCKFSLQLYDKSGI